MTLKACKQKYQHGLVDMCIVIILQNIKNTKIAIQTIKHYNLFRTVKIKFMLHEIIFVKIKNKSL